MTHSTSAKPVRQPLQVLVVEDGRVNQQLAHELLQREGHQVTVAENGLRALGQLICGRFDVVLMDVDMPVMDGITATRAVRAWEKNVRRRTPIVALTSNPNRDECLAAGMDAFLSKPLRATALREVLDGLLAPAA